MEAHRLGLKDGTEEGGGTWGVGVPSNINMQPN